MRSEGPPLFEAADLAEVLVANMARQARDIVFQLLLASSRTSRLALRRAIVPATTFTATPRLSAPQQAVVTLKAEPASDSVATCVVPFTGDGQLFQLSAPVWPRPRPLRGLVEGQLLHLTATGDPGDERWLPTMLGADLALLEQVLAAQAQVVAMYNRDLDQHVSSLLDRVLPRIDRQDIEVLRKSYRLFPADDPLAPVMQLEIDRERLRLWKEWSR